MITLTSLMDFLKYVYYMIIIEFHCTCAHQVIFIDVSVTTTNQTLTIIKIFVMEKQHDLFMCSLKCKKNTFFVLFCFLSH